MTCRNKRSTAITEKNLIKIYVNATSAKSSSRGLRTCTGGHGSGDFLKEELGAADKKMPYRVPEYYKSGQYIYRCNVVGDFTWFQGKEEIYCDGVKVYECYFHDGIRWKERGM